MHYLVNSHSVTRPNAFGQLSGAIAYSSQSANKFAIQPHLQPAKTAIVFNQTEYLSASLPSIPTPEPYLCMHCG
jgi:hypothetical protein